MSVTTPESKPEDAPCPVAVSWSGGKDSALMLQALRRDPRYRPAALLTTVTGPDARISYHRVRVDLLDRQAAALDLPLYKMVLTAEHAPNTEYIRAFGESAARLREAGIDTIAFGDIFLEDLRRWREERMAEIDMHPIFPIWGRDSVELMDEFLTTGFRARLVCVDAKKLGRDFAGRLLDRALLDDLPDGVDPCGENGEYHSFVFNGPGFTAPVHLRVGQIEARDGRFYADLMVEDAAP